MTFTWVFASIETLAVKLLIHGTVKYINGIIQTIIKVIVEKLKEFLKKKQGFREYNSVSLEELL